MQGKLLIFEDELHTENYTLRCFSLSFNILQSIRNVLDPCSLLSNDDHNHNNARYESRKIEDAL
jgi:hypothetical protein